jgi:hypothetical protein
MVNVIPANDNLQSAGRVSSAIAAHAISTRCAPDV